MSVKTEITRPVEGFPNGLNLETLLVELSDAGHSPDNHFFGTDALHFVYNSALDAATVTAIEGLFDAHVPPAALRTYGRRRIPGSIPLDENNRLPIVGDPLRPGVYNLSGRVTVQNGTSDVYVNGDHIIEAAPEGLVTFDDILVVEAGKQANGYLEVSAGGTIRDLLVVVFKISDNVEEDA